MRKAWIITYTHVMMYEDWRGDTVTPTYSMVVEAEDIYRAINASGLDNRHIISIGWAMVAI